jgi:hypothetical protein
VVGARLVTFVLMRWTHLADTEFRLLVRMAHTALDERRGATPAATYFGGHGLLVSTLRVHSDPNTALRRVRRAIAGLVAAGAVERVNAARSGFNQVYRLTLEGLRAIDNDRGVAMNQQGSTGPAEEGPAEPTEQGPTRPQSRDRRALPRNHEEPLEELYEDTKEAVSRTDLTVTRARCPTHPAMLGGNRDDGLPACPFCRQQHRAADRPKLQVLQGGAA